MVGCGRWGFRPRRLVCFITTPAFPQVHTPVIDVVLGHLKEANAAGRGNLDWTAMATTVRERSGRPATGQPRE